MVLPGSLAYFIFKSVIQKLITWNAESILPYYHFDMKHLVYRSWDTVQDPLTTQLKKIAKWSALPLLVFETKNPDLKPTPPPLSFNVP